MHVRYTTLIASLHYIENFSTYVVSHRHLRIAYNDTSLHNHREVKRSRSTKQTPPLSGTFERSHGIFHKHPRSKGQKVKVKPVFPRNVSRCMSLCGIVLHAVHVMFTCYARAVRQNRFKPVQTGSNRFKLVQTGSNRIKPEKPKINVHRQQ